MITTRAHHSRYGFKNCLDLFPRKLTTHRQELFSHTAHTKHIPGSEGPAHFKKWLLQTYLNAAVNCVTQNYLFPRCWWGLHHNVYGTKAVYSSASSMQSPTIQQCSCSFAQEHLAVRGWRKYQEYNPWLLWKKRSPFSPGTVGVPHSNCRTHSSFPPQTAFLSKLYPKSGKYLHIQSYTRLFHMKKFSCGSIHISKNSDSQRQWISCCFCDFSDIFHKLPIMSM